MIGVMIIAAIIIGFFAYRHKGGSAKEKLPLVVNVDSNIN